jgi:hypothetical protein
MKTENNKNESPIIFKAKLSRLEEVSDLGTGTILSLPIEASQKLPSRGMTIVEGSFNGVQFQAVLEPNGKESHWFKVNDTLLKASGSSIGDTVELMINPTKAWPEPKVPADIKKELSTDSQVIEVWNDITPMARWDWIRWIGATKNPDTRKKRIYVAMDKMRKGMRRACCFNRNQCTLTDA